MKFLSIIMFSILCGCGKIYKEPEKKCVDGILYTREYGEKIWIAVVHNNVNVKCVDK